MARCEIEDDSRRNDHRGHDSRGAGIIPRAAAAGADLISDYDAVRRAAEQTLRDSLPRGGDPSTVADVILRTVRTRAPRLRYAVGGGAAWIPYARILLP